MRDRASGVKYTTGWWGIPGNQYYNGFTKVHLEVDGRPACGCSLRSGMIYQWCAPGIEYDYLECERCKRIAEKHICKHCGAEKGDS